MSSLLSMYSQAYPPKPRFVAADLPDLKGKVRRLHLNPTFPTQTTNG